MHSLAAMESLHNLLLRLSKLLKYKVESFIASERGALKMRRLLKEVKTVVAFKGTILFACNSSLESIDNWSFNNWVTRRPCEMSGVNAIEFTGHQFDVGKVCWRGMIRVLKWCSNYLFTCLNRGAGSPRYGELTKSSTLYRKHYFNCMGDVGETNRSVKK